MAYTTEQQRADALSYLESGLTEFDSVIKEKTYPDIVIGNFVSMPALPDYAVEKYASTVINGRGSLNDGLIGDKTSSLVTVDAEIDGKGVKVATWAKSVQWNVVELAKASRLGVQLDTAKMNVLNHNAQQTIQKVGFVGHTEDDNITGLLTSATLSVFNESTGKSIAEMTTEEAINFFAGLLTQYYARTGGNMFPNTIAIDGFDLMSLTAKVAGISANGVPINALAVVKESLANVAGYNIDILAIPSMYGRNVADQGKSRALVYTNTDDVVRLAVYQPTSLGIEAQGLLTYQSGLIAAFSSVQFKEPELALYVDYKSSPIPSITPKPNADVVAPATMSATIPTEAKTTNKKTK